MTTTYWTEYVHKLRLIDPSLPGSDDPPAVVVYQVAFDDDPPLPLPQMRDGVRYPGGVVLRSLTCEWPDSLVAHLSVKSNMVERIDSDTDDRDYHIVLCGRKVLVALPEHGNHDEPVQYNDDGTAELGIFVSEIAITDA